MVVHKIRTRKPQIKTQLGQRGNPCFESSVFLNRETVFLSSRTKEYRPHPSTNHWRVSLFKYKPKL